MNSEKSTPDSGTASDFSSELKKMLSENPAGENLDVSSDGADLAVPPSREEIVQRMLERLEKMTDSYTLGLDTTQADLFDHLRFLNKNFFFDRPVAERELIQTESNPLKAGVKKALFPLIRNSLGVIFERQRTFNSELVKLLNQLLEVMGNQRDFNMDLIKFCERTIDHYRLMEDMERKFDDYFTYLTRLSVVEEDIEILRKRVDQLEQKPKKKSKRKKK